MTNWLTAALLGCATLSAQQAPIPANDELSGNPLAIKNKWVIGGTGKWDYLTLDPVARQLFIAHQTVVQIVDTGTGAVAGEIAGFGEAHAVVLDPNGQIGYATDGRANVIRVLDRRNFQIRSSIAVGCSARAIAFEPQTKLLFAICGAIPVVRTEPRNPGLARRPLTRSEELPVEVKGGSHVIVVDAEALRELADIAIEGDCRMVQSDDNGQVFVTVGPLDVTGESPYIAHTLLPPRIARLDAASIAADAHRELDSRHGADSGPSFVSWQIGVSSFNPHVRFLRLDGNCSSPRGLAIDGHSARLFVACENQSLEVLDAESGKSVASLTIGPGADSVAYDAGRRLIFTANGGGYGSLTVIRQHVTDTYAVIQNLPTMQQARTMAIDPSTGDLYLVTTLYGAKLDHPPANGVGTLKVDAVDGSFQVLVVGN